MPNEAQVNAAKAHFGKVVEEQLARVERLKNQPDWLDFTKIKPIKIGMIGGDGIGPIIAKESQRVLEHLLGDQVNGGKAEFRAIEGLTIENRAAQLKSIPDDVMAQIKECHVTLKGPTHTPERGDGWPNLESANVGLRKALDLFANVRPVRIPAQGIDWTFFRENTEDMYAVGSQGVNASDDLAIDFRVITTQGSERIIDAAFGHAEKTGKDTVTIVTKANVVKTTDGKFLDVARKVAERYPGIKWEGWYIDIMTAALINPGPAESSSRYWPCLTCTATSLPTRPPRFRGEWAPRAVPTSAKCPPCSKPFTAAPPAWWRRVAPTTPTPAP